MGQEEASRGGGARGMTTAKGVDASHSTLCCRPPPSPRLVNGIVVRDTVAAKNNDRVSFCGCTSGCKGIRTILSTDFCKPGLVFNHLCANQRFEHCKQILFTGWRFRITADQ